MAPMVLEALLSSAATATIMIIRQADRSKSIPPPYFFNDNANTSIYLIFLPLPPTVLRGRTGPDPRFSPLILQSALSNNSSPRSLQRSLAMFLTFNISIATCDSYSHLNVESRLVLTLVAAAMRMILLGWVKAQNPGCFGGNTILYQQVTVTGVTSKIDRKPSLTNDCSIYAYLEVTSSINPPPAPAFSAGVDGREESGFALYFICLGSDIQRLPALNHPLTHNVPPSELTSGLNGSSKVPWKFRPQVALDMGRGSWFVGRGGLGTILPGRGVRHNIGRTAGGATFS
ncbi:hypothetical protein CPB84DRAFT_1848979 [Gymnopilus junonius]|uniref:Uncharacterized protein n=1 Tax=Gymnopilus junonius TaxID=109634 RepID=A0A9P5NKT7_GYMJU|nr:hypothetical protein CPB84DRAFT_1848979 [Gymnopilus junonius]